MNWLDSALLALVGLGALLGLWSGFLWQVARVFSLTAALTASILVNESATTFLREHVLVDAEPRVAQAVAYVTVFVLVYLALFYLARMLRHTIQATDLEWLDRILGALVGAAKVAVVLAGLCLLAEHSSHPAPQAWLAQSRLGPVFAHGLESALSWVPERYRAEMSEGLEGLREMLERKGNKKG